MPRQTKKMTPPISDMFEAEDVVQEYDCVMNLFDITETPAFEDVKQETVDTAHCENTETSVTQSTEKEPAIDEKNGNDSDTDDEVTFLCVVNTSSKKNNQKVIDVEGDTQSSSVTVKQEKIDFSREKSVCKLQGAGDANPIPATTQRSESVTSDSSKSSANGKKADRGVTGNRVKKEAVNGRNQDSIVQKGKTTPIEQENCSLSTKPQEPLQLPHGNTVGNNLLQNYDSIQLRKTPDKVPVLQQSTVTTVPAISTNIQVKQERMDKTSSNASSFTSAERENQSQLNRSLNCNIVTAMETDSSPVSLHAQNRATVTQDGSHNKNKDSNVQKKTMQQDISTVSSTNNSIVPRLPKSSLHTSNITENNLPENSAVCDSKKTPVSVASDKGLVSQQSPVANLPATLNVAKVKQEPADKTSPASSSTPAKRTNKNLPANQTTRSSSKLMTETVMVGTLSPQVQNNSGAVNQQTLETAIVESVPSEIEHYNNSLIFLGSKWANLTNLSRCAYNCSITESYNGFPTLIPSVEELEFYLELDSNVNSPDIIEHAKIVCEYRRKVDKEDVFTTIKIPPKESFPSLKRVDLDEERNVEMITTSHDATVDANGSVEKIASPSIINADLLRIIINDFNLPSGDNTSMNLPPSVSELNTQNDFVIANSNLGTENDAVESAAVDSYNTNFPASDPHTTETLLAQDNTDLIYNVLKILQNDPANKSLATQEEASTDGAIKSTDIQVKDNNVATSVPQDPVIDNGESSASNASLGNSANEDSNSSVETAKSLGKKKKRTRVFIDDSDDDIPTSDSNESPVKKRKYELIMERKKTESLNVPRKPVAPESKIKDPRLANVCQKLKPVEKKGISVINALPRETVTDKKTSPKGKKDTQKSSRQNEKIVHEKTTSVGKKTHKNINPLLNERNKNVHFKHDNYRSNDDASAGLPESRSSMKQPYRGGFLTEPVSCAPAKKSRMSFETYKARKMQPTVEEYHANINVSENLTHQLDFNISHQEGAEFNNRLNTQGFAVPNQYTTPLNKDPRVNRNISFQNIASNWTQPVQYPHPRSVVDYRHASLAAEQYLPMHHQYSNSFPTNFNIASFPNHLTQPLLSTPINVLSPPIAENMYRSAVFSPNSTASPNSEITGVSSPSCSVNSSPVNSESQGLHAHVINPRPREGHTQHRPNKADFIQLPEHLKGAIGVKAIQSTDVLLIMLSWNVNWLTEQTKISTPPPICDQANIRHVRLIYKNFLDYFNTYLPLFMLETWTRIHTDWEHNGKSEGTKFSILSVEPRGDTFEMFCKTQFKRTNTSFNEDQFLQLIFSDGETSIKYFGYISNVVSNPGIQNCQDYYMYVKLLYPLSHSFRKHSALIWPLTNLKSHLSQIDSLLSVEKSPLSMAILKPSFQFCNYISFGRIKTTNDKAVADVVKKIFDSVQLENSEPRISLVDIYHGTDQLSIFEAIIEHEKMLKFLDGKAKILFCTRRTTRLNDISFRLIDDSGNQNTKFVIIAKPEDVDKKLRKYSLDDLASNSVSGTERRESLSLAKTKILKACDVLLSIVTNCFSPAIFEAIGPASDTPITICMLDDSRLCTEPESLIPIQYRIKKYIVFNDDALKPRVRSKLAVEHQYHHSFAFRLDKVLSKTSKYS